MRIKDWLEEMDYYYESKANQMQVGGNHYKDAGVQPWEVVDTWPIEQQIGFHRGNILKYLMRMGSKDAQVQEIKKARHYLDKLIEVLEKENGNDQAARRELGEEQTKKTSG